MENLGMKALLCLLITWTTVVLVEANFHIVNKRNAGSDVITLVPSNNWGCGGVESRFSALGQYPDCSGGDIRIPDGECGWSGVRIRPSCSGNYFGKIYGGSGEPEGDCYWNDSGNQVKFICGSSSIYDRLVCYSSMCGTNLEISAE